MLLALLISASVFAHPVFAQDDEVPTWSNSALEGQVLNVLRSELEEEIRLDGGVVMLNMVLDGNVVTRFTSESVWDKPVETVEDPEPYRLEDFASVSVRANAETWLVDYFTGENVLRLEKGQDADVVLYVVTINGEKFLKLAILSSVGDDESIVDEETGLYVTLLRYNSSVTLVLRGQPYAEGVPPRATDDFFVGEFVYTTATDNLIVRKGIGFEAEPAGRVGYGTRGKVTSVDLGWICIELVAVNGYELSPGDTGIDFQPSPGQEVCLPEGWAHR